MSSPQDPHAHSECARTRTVARVAALALAGAALLGSNAAHAVDCDALPNPILGIGGSAPQELVRRVAVALLGANPPITVVYDSAGGACTAMDALVPGVAGTPVALSKPGTYWNADGTTASCTYAPGSTVYADWGSMAQEAGTCTVGGSSVALPETVGDFLGPISGFSLIVPTASSEFSISAEAVYYVYGFGIDGTHNVAPWVVPAAIGSRTNTSAAGLLLAKAASIPNGRQLAFASVMGQNVSTNQGAVDYVTTAAAAVATPSAALAFCSTETAEAAKNVAKVRTLAFKAAGQDYAYFPNSTSTSFDKRNIREGRYFLWNPHHFFANKAQLTAKPALQKFINVLTSKEEIPGAQSFLDLQIENGNVPTCAMRVTRTGDMGPLSSFQPEKPCGCYFDFKRAGATSCKACTTTADCSTGSECNVGFCEVK